MNDLEDMYSLLEYIMLDHMPILNEYGLKSEEMTVYHDIISEEWKISVRSMDDLSLKIYRINKDINDFIDRSAAIERFRTWGN